MSSLILPSSLTPLFEALQKQNAETFLVGGSVRDHFLQKPLKDYDFIVRHLPMNDLIATLKNFGRVNLVGKSFGILKFSPKSEPTLEVDIALPRTEVSTGVGHRDFDVRADHTLELATDLGRRDFTINAIALNVISGEIIDPFSGREDLNKKSIRIVFPNSFAEDPLRLMRAVQFAARLNFEINPETFDSMKTQCELIRTVAPERIIQEIAKLMTAPKPSVGFDLMRDTGLLQHVFPDVHDMIGITQPNKNNEDVYTHTMKVLDAARSAEELLQPGHLEIMLSALFHDAGKPKTRREDEHDAMRVTFYNHQHISTGIAWRWMKDFKATTIGVNPKRICHLVKHHMFETKEFHNDRALRRFINKVGPDNVMDLLDLRLADKKGGRFPKKVFGILQLRDQIREIISAKPPFTPKDLALNGHDIMNLGFNPGPVLGKIQKFLMDRVLDNPELNTKEQLAQLIESERSTFESGGMPALLMPDDED